MLTAPNPPVCPDRGAGGPADLVVVSNRLPLRLEVDDGPILAQEAVPVLDADTAATLHERIKAVERRIYPAVLRQLIEEDD